MKRFLKPRSGCGRPDLGENVHRKIFGEDMVPFQGTFSRHGKAQASLALPICLNENAPFYKIRERDNDHRLRIFPFTHKKECAAINGDASRMIFKDPKSLNLKTTIVNSNKNASFRIAHPLCWRWAGCYTQIRKICYPANHLLFFTYVLKLFLYFFKQTFRFCCSAHL